MSCFIASVLDLLATTGGSVEEQVWLQLQSSRQLVVHHNLPDPHHSLINARIAVEEDLSSVEVADRLVYVQLVEEALEGGESVLSNTLACNVHREPVFSFGVLGELKPDQVGVTLSDGSENYPGRPHVRLTPLLLLGVKVLETHDTLVEHF